jgi:hypothetical protein
MAMGRATAVDHTIRRTTVDLDMDELKLAKETLGTRTARDTINSALREVNRRARLERAAKFVADGMLDVPTPNELAAMRRVEI